MLALLRPFIRLKLGALWRGYASGCTDKGRGVDALSWKDVMAALWRGQGAAEVWRRGVAHFHTSVWRHLS
jgi:hypothetical protein